MACCLQRSIGHRLSLFSQAPELCCEKWKRTFQKYNIPKVDPEEAESMESPRRHVVLLFYVMDTGEGGLPVSLVFPYLHKAQGCCRQTSPSKPLLVLHSTCQVAFMSPIEGLLLEA